MEIAIVRDLVLKTWKWGCFRFCGKIELYAGIWGNSDWNFC